MKYQIRTETFETNSSSSHSFQSINSLVEYDTLSPDSNGNIAIGIGYAEYGWGYECYNDALNKIQYIVYQAVLKKENPIAELTNPDNENMRMIREVIAGHVGISADNVSFFFEDDEKNQLGYIDHQSLDGQRFYGFDSKEDLRNLMFNKHEHLVIDHDNH
jgi:hypothetical protein